jgi:hypothetical protein
MPFLIFPHKVGKPISEFDKITKKLNQLQTTIKQESNKTNKLISQLTHNILKGYDEPTPTTCLNIINISTSILLKGHEYEIDTTGLYIELKKTLPLLSYNIIFDIENIATEPNNKTYTYDPTMKNEPNITFIAKANNNPTYIKATIYCYISTFYDPQIVNVQSTKSYTCT